MEKITFVNPDTLEEDEFFVVEETKVNGTKYLFVTEKEDGDCDAYILKEVEQGEDELIYEMVEEDTELSAVGRIFAELIEDADVKY